MMTVNGRFEYETESGRDAACWVSVYDIPSGVSLILITQLEDGYEGLSVTNGIETIATEVVREYELAPAECVWVEHYDHRAEENRNKIIPAESFDFVEFKWVADRACAPKWRAGTKEEVERLIGRKLP